MPKENLKKLYKLSDRATDYLYPLLLFLFPFANLGYGIDVTDTTYNLARPTTYLDFGGATWSMAHELSDLLVLLFMRLPFGGTMLGLMGYCTLLLSGAALLGYFYLKKYIGKPFAFLGGLIALGYCWAPVACVYNYLTYFVMTVAFVFFLKVFLEKKETYLIIAGICLGLNVFVRFPNVAEAALILFVWYGCFVAKKNAVRLTLKCLLGYVIGFLTVFIPNCLIYGLGSFPNMIKGLFSSTGEASDYGGLSMITSILKGYGRVTKWVLFMLLVVLCGYVMFRVLPNRFRTAKKVVYLGVLALMLRFFWGRGMFGLDFTQYFSMIAFATIFLMLGIAASLWVIFHKGAKESDKMLAAAALGIILISPIGSDNNVYPSINNLFLAGGITLYLSFRVIPGLLFPLKAKWKLDGYPARAMAVCVALVVLIQSVLFGMNFVFRGSDGGPMDTRVEVGRMKGMYTEKEKAAALTGLYEFFEESRDAAMVLPKGAAGTFASDKSAIFYGDVPGLCYLLNLRSALSHTWPDLDTFTTVVLKEELDAIKEPVYLIMTSDAARRVISEPENAKDRMLSGFMESHDGAVVYCTDDYTVILTK